MGISQEKVEDEPVHQTFNEDGNNVTTTPSTRESLMQRSSLFLSCIPLSGIFYFGEDMCFSVLEKMMKSRNYHCAQILL